MLPEPYEHYTYVALSLFPIAFVALCVHFVLPVCRARAIAGTASLLLFASSLGGLGVVHAIAEVRLPVLAARGQIVAAAVHGRRSKTTTIDFHTDDGRSLTLEANGTRDRFAPGQRMRVRYLQGRDQPDRGSLRQAIYLSPEDRPQGSYHSNERLYLFGLFLLVAFLVFGAWYGYRQDPLGIATASRRQAEAYWHRLALQKRKRQSITS